MKKKQSIGIIGGLGPYAGLDLVKKIFDNTKADHDQDHLPIMLYSFPDSIPVRPEFLNGQTNINPGEAIGDIMSDMSDAGAVVIGMACNTAHHPRILDVALERLKKRDHNTRFVHIVEATVQYLKKHLPTGAKIGLMGTKAALRLRLYQDTLEKNGFLPVLLDDEHLDKIQQAISNPEFGIKACSSPISEKAKSILLDGAYEFSKKKIDFLLLACTEIPLALTESELYGIRIIDATTILARELVSIWNPDKLKNAD